MYHIKDTRNIYCIFFFQVNTCAFSTDWSKIVTGGDDMLVKLWDTKTGKVLFTMNNHEGKSWNTCILICAWMIKRSFYKWIYSEGKAIQHLEYSQNLCMKFMDWCFVLTGAIKCVCFSSDGKLFASASYDHTVRIMSTTTGKEVFSLEGMREFQWMIKSLTKFFFVLLKLYYKCDTLIFFYRTCLSCKEWEYGIPFPLGIIFQIMKLSDV